MDPEKTGSEGDEPLPQAVKALPGKEAHDTHDDAGTDIINGHLIELEVDLSRVIGEDDVEGDWDADTSPFPAVRAVVPETDDPEMPVNTLRAWLLGIVSISRLFWSRFAARSELRLGSCRPHVHVPADERLMQA